ncbi:hypothetical protein C1645_841440 [Glomus cerebriforme]|uniref:Uncharacterized protein n=1 Tax=Glomus cerebriforme TaxID=658196 RepID=A0A397S2U6_9GLOM|nr:hypothetical protein C1645_841440 [Glomus cerebriforme]
MYELINVNMQKARPIDDRMINAGIFLIRNTDWAKDFIRRGLQTRYDFSSGRNSLK